MSKQMLLESGYVVVDMKRVKPWMNTFSTNRQGAIKKAGCDVARKWRDLRALGFRTVKVSLFIGAATK